MKCTLEPGNNEGNKITITIICDKQGPGILTIRAFVVSCIQRQ